MKKIPITTVPLAPLPVADFARAVARCPEVVRRRIRSGFIPARLVSPTPPYFIDPAALELFRVSPLAAAARLAPPPSSRRSEV